MKYESDWKSVDRAVAAMRALSARQHTVKSLAHALHWNMPTAQRMLSALRSLGVVEVIGHTKEKRGRGKSVYEINNNWNKE